MAKLKTGRHTTTLKALRQSEKKRSSNRKVLDTIKLAVRKVGEAVASGDKAKAKEVLPQSISTIDKAARRHVISANRARRLASRLARSV